MINPPAQSTLMPKVEVSQGGMTRINVEKQLSQLLRERATDKLLKETRTLINQLKSIVNKEIPSISEHDCVPTTHTKLPSVTGTCMIVILINEMLFQINVYM